MTDCVTIVLWCGQIIIRDWSNSIKPCDRVGTLTLVSRDKMIRCQYNKKVSGGKNFGYFSSFFSSLIKEKIWWFHKFRLCIFTWRPRGEKYVEIANLRAGWGAWGWNSADSSGRSCMSSAGLDSLRFLSKCSCINSLITQCVNAFSIFYSGVGVRCGKVANWEVWDAWEEELRQCSCRKRCRCSQYCAERDCWSSQAARTSPCCWESKQNKQTWAGI